MKKVASKKYARALYEALVDKEKEEEIVSVLENFSRLLFARNDLSRIDSIIREFQTIWNQEQGIVESEVVSARELDSESLDFLKSAIKDLSGEKQVNINNRVSQDLLGGVIIKYRDKRIDGSLKTRILNLKNRLYN